jgi:hypothetical protein
LLVKKKVDAVAASVSSTEAFPTMGLALQLEVPRWRRPVFSARKWGRSVGTLPWMVD